MEAKPKVVRQPDGLVPEYEPPRIESVLPGDELEREASFAGIVTMM